MHVEGAVRLGTEAEGGKAGRKERRRGRSPFLGRPRIVLPAAFRQRAIHAHHLSYYGGHFGLAKTFARLALRYWWPRQRAKVRAFLARCTLRMAMALAQPPDRYAVWDRRRGDVRPAQAYGPGAYPYTCAHRPPQAVGGACATRARSRISGGGHFRVSDLALGHNEGIFDGQRPLVHRSSLAAAYGRLWYQAHLQFALQPPRQLCRGVLHAYLEYYA